MDSGKVMPAEKSETVATPQTHCEAPSERTEEIARPLAALISSRGCPFLRMTRPTIKALNSNAACNGPSIASFPNRETDAAIRTMSTTSGMIASV